MTIVSDIDGLDRVAGRGTTVEVIAQQQYPDRWRRNLRLFRASVPADYLIIHFALIEVICFSVLFFLYPRTRCRLVTLDFFVVRPRRWQLPVVRWSLGRIHKLLVYFRKSQQFEALYGLPGSRFEYVPFKINSWEAVQKAPTADHGYIFVGGRSRRDFRTLFEAVADLPYPVKILTAPERDITPHGSTLSGLMPPPNVELFYNDSDSRVFVEMMSNARLVVLPILKDTAVQAGIGVYLLGMALRKCVIISEALGVSDVLLAGQALIVPPGDPKALRSAIETVWSNDALREKYAEAGYRYATPLGGEDHLRRSVLRAVGASTRDEIQSQAAGTNA